MREYFDFIYKDSIDSYFNYLDDLVDKGQKKFIVTVNPETIMFAEKEPAFKKTIFNKKNSLTPDGVAVIKKAKGYGIRIKERITGIDIAKHLLEKCSVDHKTVYLFGAKPEVIKDLVTISKKEYIGIKIVGYSDGYVKDRDKVFDEIYKLQPDVCILALGIPTQEQLISKHINKFKKGIFVGVGGSFDVLSGHKKRAPQVFINLNLEWLYRIVTEPSRIKRFFKSNVVFLFKK